jgi:hypothetical protein
MPIWTPRVLEPSAHLHLYDVGPNYLVMEYVEGVPLKGSLSLEFGPGPRGELRYGLGVWGHACARMARPSFEPIGPKLSKEDSGTKPPRADGGKSPAPIHVSRPRLGSLGSRPVCENFTRPL